MSALGFFTKLKSKSWIFVFLTIYTNCCISSVLLTVDEAQKTLFPSGSSFELSPINLSKQEAKEIKKKAKVRVFPERIQIWKVSQSGIDGGWFVVDKVIGKHELITYALAVDRQGTILGLEILEYLETHGGEVKQLPWRQQFSGKNLLNAQLKLGKDIDGLSGATLSSRNVTDGVRKLLILLESIHGPLKSSATE